MLASGITVPNSTIRCLVSQLLNSRVPGVYRLILFDYEVALSFSALLCFGMGSSGLWLRGLGGSHLQHNFSALMAGRSLLKSLAGSRKRKHSSDDDAKCTFVDQVTSWMSCARFGSPQPPGPRHQ